MPCVTWYKPTTNIQNDRDLNEYLTEINSKSPNELLIEHHVEIDKGFFSSRKIEWYKIYWDIGKGEYQEILSFELLKRQDIICYLLGILTGIDKITKGY